MKKFGLLSDTHGYLDPRVYKHFKDCDEIWHAGDIGTVEVIEKLEAFKPTRAVFGNIDGHDVRIRTIKNASFMCEKMKILITHIGGYPPKYKPGIIPLIKAENPDIFICGHSHILKVMPDKRFDLLHMNPGACGNHGFHKVKTLLRFEVHLDQIKNLEAIELLDSPSKTS